MIEDERARGEEAKSRGMINQIMLGQRWLWFRSDEADSL